MADLSCRRTVSGDGWRRNLPECMGYLGRNNLVMEARWSSAQEGEEIKSVPEEGGEQRMRGRYAPTSVKAPGRTLINAGRAGLLKKQA
jgi:hypothetical protein